MRGIATVSLATLIALVAVLLLAPDRIVERKIWHAFADIPLIEHLVEDFRQRTGSLPTDTEGLFVVLQGPGERLARAPLDPWDHAYVYRRSTEQKGYVVYSVGRNGVDEVGGGDDITTESKPYSCADYGINCPTNLRMALLGLATVCVLLGLLVLVYLSVAALVRRILKRRAA